MALRTQRDRSFKMLNMHLIDRYDCDEDGWPEIMPAYTVPDRLITFCMGDKDKDGFAHLYIDDYRFERLWNRPEQYLNELRKYKGVIAPDFSTYTDMPYPMQIWNKYRSMALTAYWQREGIDVIPNLQWSDERSLYFAFNGLPEGGVFCTSTVGNRTKEARRNFQMGLDAALEVLDIETLLVYGSWHGYDVHGMCDVVRYENDNRARLQMVDDKKKAEKMNETDQLLYEDIEITDPIQPNMHKEG